MHAKKKTHGQKIGLSKYLIEIPKVGSKKTGSLYFAEINKHIPFDVKRIYYIANVQDAARGFHAHKQTVQVLFCIKGSVKIILETPEDREEFVLDQAHAGLILDKMVWHEMTDFEEDTLVLVLASDFYNESDYIRNYNDFVALSRPQIKFNDFKKEYQSLKTDIDSAVGRALESGWYILGEELKRFEQDFANYCGTKYCVGVGNAYDGLKLVLKALGVGPGDEVITTAHTAVATALAITDAGA
ncbi:WxcM-like domain-containing protein, partial [Patescibacteria group bacterium]|nr:WxcM-like domain-containing protein [Patescibacteria group bacterium]